MPPLITVGDSENLIPTKEFPLGTLPFDTFNPVQSRFFEHYDKDCNVLVAASTSAGKTTIAEMVFSHEIRKNHKKGIYVCPLKALAQEKYDEWRSPAHHFKDLKISICTGDYQLTEKRKKELDEADLIIITAEMMNSRCRNAQSEKSKFLFDAGVLVIDEFHIIGVSNRGAHLEAGLMNFTELNKECRFVGLSATLPNVEEIAKWISYVLNKKQTVLLASKFRPCPLFVHFEQYIEGGTYDETEYQKVRYAMEIVNYYPEDKFLIFAHTKRTGELMKKELQKAKIDCEFHNADVEKSKRVALEKRFKNDPDFRVIVATSTLAWGLDTPARRVIVLGVHRGLEEVANYDVMQMCVAADSRIMLFNSNKMYCSASEIKITDVVAGVTDDCKIVGNEVLNIYKKLGNTKKITFSNGTVLELSNHPLLSWDGDWINSDDLKVGDKICITNKGVLKGGKSLRDIFYEKVKNISCYFRIDEQDKCLFLSKSNSELSDILKIKKKSVSKFRKRFIVKNRVAKEMNIALRFPRSQNGHELDLDKLDYEGLPWLLGIMATDGNCRINKSCTKIRLYNTRKSILDKFKKILNNCGLYVGIYTDKKTGRISYECSSHALVQIISLLGITPRKTWSISIDALLEMTLEDKALFLQGVIDGDGNYSKNIRIATASRKFAYQLKEMFLALGTRCLITFSKGSGEVFGYKCNTNHYIVSVNDKKSISNILKYSKDGFKLSKFTNIIRNTRPTKNDFFYTKVKLIEDIGEKELVNFSVSGSNTFIVDDIITHNCGRSGRPRYDPAGDAYILLPASNFEDHKERIRKPRPILSQMLEEKGSQYKMLAFHIVSEIYKEQVKTREDVKEWFKRSLACWQQADDLPPDIIDHMLDSLRKCGAIWEEDGIIVVTAVGKVASLFYYSPFDVADLKRNFNLVFERRKENDDLWVSMALGNLDTHRFGIVSRAEREEMSGYQYLLQNIFGRGAIWEPAIKAGFAYNKLLQGQKTNFFHSLCRNLQFDFPRLIQVVKSLDSMSGKWGRRKWFDMLELRIKHGVKPHLVNLCRLPNVGKVRAEKLYQKGITDLSSVLAHSNRLHSILKLKPDKIEAIITEAKKLLVLS